MIFLVHPFWLTLISILDWAKLQTTNDFEVPSSFTSNFTENFCFKWLTSGNEFDANPSSSTTIAKIMSFLPSRWKQMRPSNFETLNLQLRRDLCNKDPNFPYPVPCFAPKIDSMSLQAYPRFYYFLAGVSGLFHNNRNIEFPKNISVAYIHPFEITRFWGSKCD